MFSRRNRAPSIVRSHGAASPGPAPSSAASLAAAQAFLANRASNADLSAAAAAAALRSQAKSPQPVSEIQTKRMIQRRNSQSSQGSAPGGPIILGRRGSSGSMTERSFRAPSPNRPPSRSAESPMPPDHPPVPPVPVRYGAPHIPAKSHKRPSSTEPPERVSSPAPLGHIGRGVSLDRGPSSMPPKPKTGKKQRQTSLVYFAEEPQSRRNSTNFSRPISPQNPSPTKSGQMVPPALRTQPTSVAPESSTEDRQTTEHRPNAISTPSGKKKPKAAALTASHLAMGTSSMKPVGSAVHELDARQAPEPMAVSASPSRPAGNRATPKKKKVVTSSVVPSSSMGYTSDSDNASERSATDHPRTPNKRPTGFLTKQPSMVREDPEAEAKEEQFTATKTRSRAQNGTPHPPIASHEKPGTSMASAELLPATRYEPESRTAGPSFSPARAARLTPQTSLGTTRMTKHEPPERSLSPAKSALKRSTSPAGSGQAYKPGIAPSEASDVSSNFSEDGPRTQPKRKPKVSFDEGLAIIGQTVTPPSSHNSSASTPQETKKSWFGIGSKKGQPTAKIEDDVIKPVPVLPSFGSIRGRKDKQDGAGPIMESASKSNSASVPVDGLGISHDHALGHVLQRDLDAHASPAIPPVRASPSSGPLPPQVTSVEGSGYHSESDDSTVGSHGDDSHGHAGDGVRSKEGQSIATDFAVVPMIAVQPATPGGEHSTEPVDKWVAVSAHSSGELIHQDDHEGGMVDHQPAEGTPSTAGIAEPIPDAAHLPDERSPGVAISEAIRHQAFPSDSDSETGNSVYSDAAEEVSDGDGFGSINAIVESPVIPKTVAQKVSAVAPSPMHEQSPPPGSSALLSEQPVASDTQEPVVQDWNEAKAHWSGLSQSRKAQIEEEAKQVEQATSTATAAKPQKARKAASAVTGSPTGVQHAPQAVPVAPVTPRVASGSPAPHLRSSMRGTSPTSELQQVKSARRTSAPVGQSPGMRSSMRKSMPDAAELVGRAKNANASLPRSDANGVLPKKSRPLSATPVAAVSVVDYLSKPTKGAGHTRAASASAALTPIAAKRTANVPPVPVKPTTSAKAAKKPLTVALRRTVSNGSDSSSSFKKARATGGRGDGHTMRRSMRSASERPKSELVSSKLSIRSTSPRMESRRPLSPGMGMRTTMRDSAKGTRPMSPTRSLGFGRSKSPSGSLGFGRGSARSPVKAPANSISRFRSRFNDSSDDEDGPATYQSRFADSSDEEDAPGVPKGLTPVRGIPKRIDEGESTDLEDSADEISEVKPPPVTPKKPPPIVTKGTAIASQGTPILGHNPRRFSTVASKSPVPPESKKRRGLLEVLGRRKDKAKIQKTDVESAARRDTPLERTRFERNSLVPVEDPSPASAPSSMLKNSSNDSPQSSPRSPKLQRRNTPKRYTSDSWPAPPPIPAASGSQASTRPHTSDGVPRPAMGTRTLTGQTTQTVRATPVTGRMGKKKRFPMLRKAFGLTD